MKIKSPRDPILLSDRDFDNLEKMLKRNEKRTKLTKQEKVLLEASNEFDGKLSYLFNGKIN